jgi:hypothetical protein
MQLLQDELRLELAQPKPIFRRQRPRFLFHPIELGNQQQRRPHTGLIRLQRFMKVSSGMRPASNLDQPAARVLEERIIPTIGVCL